MLEPYFFVARWLDEGSAIIPGSPTELIVKPSANLALATLGLRCKQSPHKIPEGAMGFYICLKERDGEINGYEEPSVKWDSIYVPSSEA